jgi:hypothetical protein
VALEDKFAHLSRVNIFKNGDAAIHARVGRVTFAPLKRLIVGASEYGS